MIKIKNIGKVTEYAIDKKLGAIFKSHLDGKKIILSPEKSIQVQKTINSDIMMVLDECPQLTNDKIINKIMYLSSHKLELFVLGAFYDTSRKYLLVSLKHLSGGRGRVEC